MVYLDEDVWDRVLETAKLAKLFLEETKKVIEPGQESSSVTLFVSKEDKEPTLKAELSATIATSISVAASRLGLCENACVAYVLRWGPVGSRRHVG